MTAPAIKPRRSMPWLFPIVYLTVTHSTVGLMVMVGLLGNPVLAADIALVHGATVATFHALSANTRVLILGQSRIVGIADILRMRVVLVGPLAVAAFVLATSGTGVATWLALALVVRRCGEWFNDLQLCKAELERRRGFATGFFSFQIGLLGAAAIALATQWEYAHLVVAAWALLPLGLALDLTRVWSGERVGAFPRILRRVLPHAGSTAISGVALYALRILVVLLIAKDLAGDLFTAIAIGSFIGTVFANVLGPSLELHEQRTGHGMPLPVKLVVLGMLGLGIAVSIAALYVPQSLSVLGKPQFFWLSCGLSLIGGVVMVRAQQVRLRVMRPDDARDIFGPEVLIHVALLVATPLLILAGGTAGASSLYLINAILAYLFYRSSEMAQQRITAGDRTHLDWVRYSVAFLLVFPLFFQLVGRIYNSREVVLDSGGHVLTLPLPVSILACFMGLVLLADYRRAARSVAFISLFFGAMFLSAVVTRPTGEAFDRAHLLLLMQFLLPAFGLSLGEMFETPRTEAARILERAFFWSCATIIPGQLIASWLQGQAVLTHWVGLFSVYQHHQFVPVVLVCAVLVSIPALRRDSVYRLLALPLLFLSLIYAVSASSLLPIFVAGTGLLALGARHLPKLGWKRGLAVSATALIIAGAFLALIIQTPGNILRDKLITLGALQDEYAVPCTLDPLRQASPLANREGSAWLIRGLAPAPDSPLIQCRSRPVSKGDALLVEGEVRSGGVTVNIVAADASPVLHRGVDQPGAFRVELRPADGEYQAVVSSHLPEGTDTDVTITRIAWLPPFSDQPMVVAGEIPETLARILPLNIVERISDWVLFGRPVFSSVETFFFGHASPLARTIRTSAHNYYIDLAYNFGAVALIPLAGLLLYTLRLIWLHRRDFWLNARLAWIGVIVLFLLLVDSNFKVTLRQPYPGIFAFFLWGVLLARLRTRDIARDLPQQSALRTQTDQS